MTEKRRANGTGTIEVHRGRLRVRAFVEGRRTTIARFALGEEDRAQEFLDAWNLERAEGVIEAPTQATIASIAPGWLDLRELEGSDTRAEVRDVESERSLYRRHIAEDPIARLPLAAIATSDVKAFTRRLRSRKRVHALRSGTDGTLLRETGETISRSTQRHALRLLSALLEHARQKLGLVSNPAAGVHVAADAGSERDLSDDWLRAREIDQLLACEALPRVYRRAYACAIGLALRERDIHSLEVARVHLEDEVVGPHVWVEIAKKKVRRPHRIPILPWLVPIVREQLESLPDGARWLFPNRDGDRYGRGYDFRWASKPERRMVGRGERRRLELVRTPSALEVAGIARRIRFHDLRGSTATHLALGTWGRRWSLHEIQGMLVHSDQRVTERYVKRAIDMLATAAAGTSKGPALPPVAPAISSKYSRTQSDSNARPTAPEALGALSDRAGLDPLGGNAGAAGLAAWVITTIAGDEHGVRRVIERCEAIVRAAQAAEEESDVG